MSIIINFITQAYDQLGSWVEAAIYWLSTSFIPLLFQASYYLGIGTGVLIGFAIFSTIFDKIMTYLTYRFETSTYGIVPEPPTLTEEQKNLLKDALYWWNKQCDSWYITKPVCVEKALSGKEINLIDVRRIGDATQTGRDFGRFKPSEETQKIFDKLNSSLSRIGRELQKEVDYKKLNHQLIKEMDTLSKQLKIAQYSALAAVASAIATAFLAYITYMTSNINFTSP